MEKIRLPFIDSDCLYRGALSNGTVGTGINSCGRSKYLDCSFFYHGYLEEEKSMIHSFTVTFGTKYLTGMVTSVPPYETFNLI